MGPTHRTVMHRRTPVARRHLIAAVLGALVASLLTLPSPAQAVPDGITFNMITPVDGGDLLVARTAADDPRDPPTFQLKADIWLANTNFVNDSEVTAVRFSYPGSSIADRTYTPMEFPSGQPPQLFSVPARDTGRVPVHDGLDRDLPLPLPASVQIDVFVDGDPAPIELMYGLRLRDNPVPNNAYFFPAKASDLAPGEYWRFETRHVVDAGGGGGTLNPSTRTQRYSLDMDLVRWNGASWSWVKPGEDGTDNDDYWGFGEPMYAMADGVVISCYRGEQDHAPDTFENITFDNGFGNSLVIAHGGDRVTYAHMRFDSIPTHLCPSDGQNNGLSIPVEAGDHIGDMGNTGRSTNAHLHLQVEHLDGNDPVQGVPIQFVNIRALGDDGSLAALGGTPTLQPLHGLALHRNSLILPNPCGLDDLPPSGLAEVSRHGIPAACYQDVFNQIASRGYRPVFVDGYDVAGQTYFNATFRPSGPASVARHGLTGTEYQDLFDDLTDDGYRLHQVDSYLEGGQVRYAAIFEIRSGPAFAAFHGLDDAAYDARLADLADEGYVPVNVSTVQVGGDLYWSGLFEQVPVTGWTVESVPVAAYQTTFDANAAAGRIPTYVHGFSTSGGPHLTGIWVDPMGASTQAVHGLSSAEYQDAFDSNLGSGRLTRAVTGYDSGGTDTYAAVWRARPDTTLTTTPPAATNQTSATFAFEANDPFATFECAVDAASFSACESPSDVTGLAEGWHTFQVRAVDRELLRDATPASFTWLVDLTPPEVDITSPPEDTKTVHGDLKDDPVEITTVVGWADVTATATDALSGIDTVGFTVDGAPVPPQDVDHVAGSDQWSFQFAPDQNGQQTYEVVVTATDVAGNAATDTLTIDGTKTNKPKP